MRTGRPPKPTHLKLIAGNPGRRPLPSAEPMPSGRPTPPVELTGRLAAIWARHIEPAFWLTASDSTTAWLWCQLQHEAEQSWAPLTAEMLDDCKLPEPMTSPRIAQLRMLGSELGFTPTARARIGNVNDPGGKKAETAYW